MRLTTYFEADFSVLADGSAELFLIFAQFCLDIFLQFTVIFGLLKAAILAANNDFIAAADYI